MGYETGAVKWFFGMLLTVPGYVSLYIFGDGIWNTITNAQAILTVLSSETLSGVIRGLVEIYVPTPETFLSSLVVYPLVGGIVAALLWYKGSKF